MYRLGVLGGTFDPIHNGHLNAARQVADELDLAGVIFVPAGDPYQRDTPGASKEDRVAMTELAIADDERFVMSRVDIDRDGPTYSIDTIKDLRAAGHDDLVLIVGTDALAGITTWKEWEHLVKETPVAVMVRPGYEITNPGIPDERLIVVEEHQSEVSATEIRERISNGEPIDDLVPEPVAEYIARKKLYR